MDRTTKSRLEELRAAVERETGETVTEQEIVSRLLLDAADSPATVVDWFGESSIPLSEDECERMNEGTFSSGVETDEKDIDDALYGSEHNP